MPCLKKKKSACFTETLEQEVEATNTQIFYQYPTFKNNNQNACAEIPVKKT